MEETGTCKKKYCVRIEVKKGFKFKLYKTNLPNEMACMRYHFSGKYVEKLVRGFPPTFEAERKRFPMLQKFAEVLKPKALPAGFQSFSDEEKKNTSRKLVEEIVKELAAAVSDGPDQGEEIQGDGNDAVQEGAGSARQFDTTDREGQDVGMQVNNPGQTQADEVQAEAPNPDFGNTVSNDASLQNVAWNEQDNFQSRYSFPVKHLVWILSDIERRASRFSEEALPKFGFSEEAFRSFLSRLEFLEVGDVGCVSGALVDDSNTLTRSREGEILERLYFSYEDLQNGTSMPGSLADEFCSNSLTSPKA